MAMLVMQEGFLPLSQAKTGAGISFWGGEGGGCVPLMSGYTERIPEKNSVFIRIIAF